MATEIMTGIILAGGKNSRIGTNKAFLVVNGTRIIDRTLRILSDICAEILIVTNDPLAYLDLNVTLVTDILPNMGALGGLYSGLFFASHNRSLVCACDMPFINPEFIEYMIRQDSAYDCVVPDAGDGLQPMHAIYDKKCLPEIRNLLDRGRLKITDLYQNRKTLVIGKKIIAPFDPEKKMFLNVNTFEDLQFIDKKRGQNAEN